MGVCFASVLRRFNVGTGVRWYAGLSNASRCGLRREYLRNNEGAVFWVMSSVRRRSALEGDDAFGPELDEQDDEQDHVGLRSERV